MHRQSAYLAGRDRRVADIPTDHPSCSSQHAVLQYRLVRAWEGRGEQHAVLQYRLVREYDRLSRPAHSVLLPYPCTPAPQVALPSDPGDMAPPVRVVKPYVLDLESTNGCGFRGGEGRVPTTPR